MGYACPVCDVPQRDGEHLANHLAFTAMLRGGAHADWLDEHAPDWESSDPATLADHVTDAAEETAYDEVFEDTTDDAAYTHGGTHDHAGDAHGHTGHADDHAAHGHEHAHGSPGGHGDSSGRGGSRGPRAGGVDDVMRDARELTREMYGVDDADDSGDEPERQEASGDAADSDSDTTDSNGEPDGNDS